MLPFSSTVMLVRRRLGGGAGGLVGASWWCCGCATGYAGLLSVEALRRRVGVGYRLSQDRAVGMVLSRVKAFTDTFVGGDGGGALVAPFSLLGAPLGGTIFLLHWALYGENIVHLWTCDGGAIGVVPSLEASHLEFQLG